MTIPILDARGLSCPLPLLKLKQALNKLESGAELQVLTTDPGSVRDFKAYLNQTSNSLLQFEQAEDHYQFIIRKGGPS